MLTFEEYQTIGARLGVQEHESQKEAVMHWAIGMGEEAGEVLGVVKHKYYGNQYDVADMLAELGDAMWYIASMCTTLGISMADVAEFNLAKLHNRYPTGDFDATRSAQRHELDEQFKSTETYATIVGRVREAAARVK